MFIQTRQILHQFCCYLAKLNGSQEGLVQIRKRLIESNLMVEPVLELREISELHYDEDELINDKENISHNGESSLY
jgi:hypothetical protein